MDAAKAVLYGKFVALNSYIRKEKISNQWPQLSPEGTRERRRNAYPKVIHCLSQLLLRLEGKKKNKKLKVIRRKEIIKNRVATNEIGNRKAIKSQWKLHVVRMCSMPPIYLSVQHEISVLQRAMYLVLTRVSDRLRCLVEGHGDNIPWVPAGCTFIPEVFSFSYNTV